MKKFVSFVATVAMICLLSTALAVTASYHSSNDSSIAKQGNSGIYAYYSDGYNYDNYFIIDFDEGYVYYFQEGVGSTFCDRIKIDSGTLNDVVIITYHDGTDEWSDGFHFKWVNQPDHLVMQDNDGFEYDYYTTDLKEALKLRDGKTITDY